jgi:hypothetical protein
MFDDEWQFLVERVERVVDDHYAVMVIGSVSPIMAKSACFSGAFLPLDRNCGSSIRVVIPPDETFASSRTKTTSSPDKATSYHHFRSDISCAVAGT